MNTALTRAVAPGLLALALALVALGALAGMSGCSRNATGQATANAEKAAADPRQATIHQPGPAQHALGITQPWSDADIRFMTGMIPHHAQALVMAGWAPTHGARADVAILCERMVVGQTDEIRMMQQWLADRGVPVPAVNATPKMPHSAGGHHLLMPGMLTDDEMAALDKARGPDFDRLFLLGMIKHHQGAIDMVDELMKAYGAAQDDSLYQYASDVYADQSIEIDAMKRMLEQKRGGS
jgi:uncharacterized protein (DUF305 family)